MSEVKNVPLPKACFLCGSGLITVETKQYTCDCCKETYTLPTVSCLRCGAVFVWQPLPYAPLRGSWMPLRKLKRGDDA